MEKLFYFYFILSVLGCGHPKNRKEQLKEIVDYYRDSSNRSEISSKDLLNLHDVQLLLAISEDSAQIVQSLNSGKNVNKVVGAPMSNEEFDRVVKTFNYPSSVKDSTDYVFFYEEDIRSILDTAKKYSNPNSDQIGLKILLRKYKSNFYRDGSSSTTPHKFHDRNTVILQAVINGLDTFRINGKDTFFRYDFGDVCPPNCKNTCKYGDRTKDEMRDGEGCK